jgi:hypothetical protein
VCNRRSHQYADVDRYALSAGYIDLDPDIFPARHSDANGDAHSNPDADPDPRSRPLDQ